MYILSPSVTIFHASLLIATLTNFLILIFLLSKIFLNERVLLISVLLIILTPSIYLHSVTFLREVYVYTVLCLFFYFYQKSGYQYSTYRSIIFICVIAVIRVDMAILITPLFIYFCNYKQNFRYVAYVTCILLTYFIKINYTAAFDGYRYLFGMPEYLPIYKQIFNFYLPSEGSSTALLISVWELALIFSIWIILLYYRQYHNLVLAYICMQIIGVILLGDVSDNIGFVSRIRSIILFSILMSLCLEFIRRNNSIKKSKL